MRKGKEILTIAELREAIKSCHIYINGFYVHYTEDDYQCIYGDSDKTFNHALPDYKVLDQRVFDGARKCYIKGFVNRHGSLFLITKSNSPDLYVGNYEPNQEITRDFTSDGYTLDEAKQFLKDGVLEFNSLIYGWETSIISESDMNICALSNYRKKPVKQTYTLTCGNKCNINI